MPAASKPSRTLPEVSPARGTRRSSTATGAPGAMVSGVAPVRFAVVESTVRAALEAHGVPPT